MLSDKQEQQGDEKRKDKVHICVSFTALISFVGLFLPGGWDAWRGKGKGGANMLKQSPVSETLGSGARRCGLGVGGEKVGTLRH